MDTSFHRLIGSYEDARAAGRPLVLASLIETAGSTYRKAGAHMLIGDDGQYAGLLSGGCLEADLAEHARRVLQSTAAMIVSYDMRGPDDPLWGLGAGCEGAMQILLSYCGPQNGWRPLPWLAASLTADATFVWGLIVSPASNAVGASNPTRALGAALAVADASDAEQRAAVARAAASERAEITRSANGEQILWLAVAPPPSLVLCGGGPDAIPVAELARFLGWQVIVCDHRAGYARADRFARGVRVLQQRPAPLAQLLGKERVAAAVIMSHHLETDLAWLKALADAVPAYVGLLGPAPRREKLLKDLSPAQRVALKPHLHAPVGLDLGGRTPEEIALAMVAQIQAAMHGREGRPFE